MTSQPSSDDTTTASTTSPPKPFPFLALPRELRDQIYTLLITSTPIPIRKTPRPPPHCYGIILTSHQTYTETLKLFYNASTFVIEEAWARRGVEWLAALDEEKRAWIGRVVFRRDVRSFGCMYSKMVFRAVGGRERQAMLLEPFWRELEGRGVRLGEGVLRA